MTASMEEKSSLMEMMWKNWDIGFQAVCNVQKEIDKSTQEMLKAQKEIISSLSSEHVKGWNELNHLFNDYTKMMKEQVDALDMEDLTSMFDSWNEKVHEIVNQFDKIAETPNKNYLNMIKQFNEKFYQSTLDTLNKKEIWQKNSFDEVEEFISNLKKNQVSFFNLLNIV